MAEAPLDPETNDDAGTGAPASRRTPRWVKVFLTIAVVLALLLFILLLTGGPDRHGPGRHTGSADGGGQAPPAAVTDGHKPPSWLPDQGQP